MDALFLRDGKVRRWLLGSLVGLMSCKEEFPFLTLMVAIVMFIKGVRLRGIIVGFLSVVFIAFAFLIRPLIWGQTYPHGGFLTLLIQDPMIYVKRLAEALTDHRVAPPLALIVVWSLGMSLQRNWDILLMVVPPLMVRGMSLQADAFNFHYAAIFVPFLILILIRELTAGEIVCQGRIRLRSFKLMVVVLIGLALRPSPFHHPFSRAIYFFKHQDEIAHRNAAVKTLADPNLKISAPNNWIPHLTARDEIAAPNFYLERGTVNKVDAWVWDVKGDYFPSQDGMDELQAQVIKSLDAELVFSRERYGPDVEVWREKNNGRIN